MVILTEDEINTKSVGKSSKQRAWGLQNARLGVVLHQMAIVISPCRVCHVNDTAFDVVGNFLFRQTPVTDAPTSHAETHLLSGPKCFPEIFGNKTGKVGFMLLPRNTNPGDVSASREALVLRKASSQPQGHYSGGAAVFRETSWAGGTWG